MGWGLCGELETIARQPCGCLGDIHACGDRHWRDGSGVDIGEPWYSRFETPEPPYTIGRYGREFVGSWDGGAEPVTVESFAHFERIFGPDGHAQERDAAARRWAHAWIAARYARPRRTLLTRGPWWMTPIGWAFTAWVAWRCWRDR
jgi:hypothetical protein